MKTSDFTKNEGLRVLSSSVIAFALSLLLFTGFNLLLNAIIHNRVNAIVNFDVYGKYKYFTNTIGRFGNYEDVVKFTDEKLKLPSDSNDLTPQARDFRYDIALHVNYLQYGRGIYVESAMRSDTMSCLKKTRFLFCIPFANERIKFDNEEFVTKEYLDKKESKPDEDFPVDSAAQDAPNNNPSSQPNEADQDLLMQTYRDETKPQLIGAIDELTDVIKNDKWYYTRRVGNGLIQFFTVWFAVTGILLLWYH